MNKRNMLLAAVMVATFGATAGAAESKTVNVAVTENGFEPSSVDVKAGTDVTLKVTRKTDTTCATQLQVGSKKEKVDLPLNKAVSVKVGKVEKGEIRFACGMDMLSGLIIAK